MGDSPKSRLMKFPYTAGAAMRLFPYKFYYNTGWFFKYWLIASVVCSPVFWKLQKLSYSEENVKLWREIRRQEFEGPHR